MLNSGGYYAVAYKNGFVPVKIFAITETEATTLYHITIFTGLYDRIEQIPPPDEHDYLVEHVAVVARIFEQEILHFMQNYPVFADEENLYRIWKDDWNNTQAVYYALRFEELLPALCAGGN